MAKTQRFVPPELILEGHAPAVVALAEQARRLVKEVAPDAVEAGYPGWRLIGYRRRGYFAFVSPHADHVRIGFERGRWLPDPERLLEGDGAQVRHVRVERPEDLRRPGLRVLLLAAMELDERR